MRLTLLPYVTGIDQCRQTVSYAKSNNTDNCIGLLYCQ
jgi:hypothetical protein